MEANFISLTSKVLGDISDLLPTPTTYYSAGRLINFSVNKFYSVGMFYERNYLKLSIT